jgi:hypothetical protein
MSGDEDRNPLNVIQLPRESSQKKMGSVAIAVPGRTRPTRRPSGGIDLRTITTVDRAYRHREVAT